MALNATPGASDANSYVTLAEATAYFSERAHADAWDDFINQEALLITSSRMLDWYVRWKGNKSSITQSMQWPRTEAIRPNGVIVDTDIIPEEVKVAVFELALSSVESDRTEESAMAGLEQVKAGSLMIKADSGDLDSTDPEVIPEKVWRILSDLYSRGSLGVVRLVRA